MDAISVARFLSVPSAFLVSGYGISFSQNSVPLIYNQPASISAPIFTQVYYQGAKFVAPGAIISTAASAYLAYTTPHRGRFFAAAALLTLATQPFTLFVMGPGIQRLIEISKDTLAQQQADQTGEVVRLLQTWVAQNWFRAAMSFAAGMVNFWAQYTS